MRVVGEGYALGIRHSRKGRVLFLFAKEHANVVAREAVEINDSDNCGD